MIAESIKETQGNEGNMRATKIPLGRILPEVHLDRRKGGSTAEPGGPG
jgi:hypothetical protein